jgi:DivIVA domain-containing protein
MTQPDPQFRVVMRGYDPADVDRVVAELTQRATDAEARLESASAVAEAAPVETPTYEHLGERVGQILALADQEAKDLRERAHAEAEDARKAAEQAAVGVRDQADQYAEQTRRDADTEAARILTDARRAADEERDAAERDAAALRQEGEAAYEQQRANAAKAAADFETTLAERRERTAAEFREQQAAAQAQLDTMLQRVEETRASAQREQEAAEAQARQIVMEAQERAEGLVAEARATADRIRTDSERELAAATQRRDSINQQLTTVRQMLATLTGSATGFAVDPLPGQDRAADEPEPVEEEAGTPVDAEAEGEAPSEGEPEEQPQD